MKYSNNSGWRRVSADDSRPSCNPCGKPCPPPPIYITCRPCGSPTPECPPFPTVRCEGGVAVFSSVSEPLSLSPQTVDNVFSTNDGPAPYTPISAEFVGAQQALYDLREETANLEKRLTFTLRPSIRLSYNDGRGVTRTKFIIFPLDFEHSFSAPTTIPGLRYHAELSGGTITGLSFSGNTLNFTPEGLTLKFIAYSEARRFSVIKDHNCDNPPSAPPTECISMQSLKFICTMASNTFYQNSTTPYNPSASPPDQVVSLTPLDTAPNILSAQSQYDGSLYLEMSFPATLVMRDSTGATFSQETLIYTSVLLKEPLLEAGDTLIVDLRARITYGPYVSGNTLFAYISVSTGGIMALSGQPVRVLTTSVVDCGPFEPGAYCEKVEIEPTTAP